MLTLAQLREMLPMLFKRIREHPSPNKSSRHGAWPRLAVIHVTVSSDTSYEAMCDYLSRAGVGVSSHYVVDALPVDETGFTRVSRLVAESEKAWTALSANPVSINYELIGQATRTRDEWLGKYKAQLRTAAALVAEDCIEYGIPAAYGDPGVVGHVHLSKLGYPNNHTDPGPGFPWDVFYAEVRRFIDGPAYPNLNEVPAKSGNAVSHDIYKWRWTWMRWRLGVGEFKEHGPMNRAHRPAGVPTRIPKAVWEWGAKFLAARKKKGESADA